MKVCVVDTGLDVTHEDLRGLSVGGWKSDGNGHGTHVTGTIAAQQNDYGVIGVAPDASIYVALACDKNGYCYASSIMNTVTQCVNAGADIISMSIGGTGWSTTERNFYDNVRRGGTMIIAASGNSGSTAKNYPASYPSVMSVAAVDANEKVASFSTRNNKVDIAAPGVRVASTYPGNRYVYMDGTSMATPHVSGVAALLKSYRPNATVDQIFNAMKNTARDKGAAGYDIYYGAGIVDAVAALRAL